MSSSSLTPFTIFYYWCKNIYWCSFNVWNSCHFFSIFIHNILCEFSRQPLSDWISSKHEHTGTEQTPLFWLSLIRAHTSVPKTTRNSSGVSHILCRPAETHQKYPSEFAAVLKHTAIPQNLSCWEPQRIRSVWKQPPRTTLWCWVLSVNIGTASDSCETPSLRWRINCHLFLN